MHFPQKQNKTKQNKTKPYDMRKHLLLHFFFFTNYQNILDSVFIINLLVQVQVWIITGRV